MPTTDSVRKSARRYPSCDPVRPVREHIGTTSERCFSSVKSILANNKPHAEHLICMSLRARRFVARCARNEKKINRLVTMVAKTSAGHVEWQVSGMP